MPSSSNRTPMPLYDMPSARIRRIRAMTFCSRAFSTSRPPRPTPQPYGACPLDAHGAARPLPNHRSFQLGENAGHLSHRTPVRVGHIETLSDGYQLDAFLVELGNDVGRIGDGAK